METVFTIQPVAIALPPITARMAEVMRMFGVTADRLRGRPMVGGCEVSLRPGQIALVTGFSGAGKTTALMQMSQQVSESQRLWLGRDLGEAESKADSVVDAMGGETREALAWLAKAGLSDARVALQRPTQLSGGQFWRFQLAQALASAARVVFIDEFAATLDAINAATVSHRLRKIADAGEKIFVVASGRYDFACDLSPDVTIEMQHGGQAIVTPRMNTAISTATRRAWLEETWPRFYGLCESSGGKNAV
jgi:ABC-type ATPase with predicted acetyltransferase domain